MAKVELKQPIVEEISGYVKDAQSIVLVDYRGLTVAEDTKLRKDLREAGVTYKVYKNTMLNFAFKGGVVDGVVYDAAGIAAVASIPSREELLSKLLGSMQSPIANFARCMKQLAEKGGASDVAEEAAPAAEAPVEEAAPAAEAEAPVEAPAEEAPAETPAE